jgi:WD40 repeat protein
MIDTCHQHSSRNFFIYTIRIIFLFFPLFTIAGCSSSTRPPTSENDLIVFDPTVTQLPINTNTPEPTFTPTYTPTASPTEIVLPVGNGNPIPNIGFVTLSTSNISKIEPIARYGVPERINVKLDPQNAHIFITTVEGIQIIDSANQNLVAEIKTRIPFGVYFDVRDAFDIQHDMELGPPVVSGNGQFILLFNPDLDLDLWSIDGAKIWTKKMDWKNNSGDLRRVSRLSASISPDANLLAQSYCDGMNCRLLITNSQTDEKYDEFEGSFPLFSNSGKYLTYILKDKVAIYNVDQKQRKLISTISMNGSFGKEFLVENGGQTDRIAIVQWDKVLIWDIESNQKVSTITGFKLGGDARSLPSLVQFSPDGNYVIIGTFKYPQELVVYASEGSKINELPYDATNTYWIENNKIIKNEFLDEKRIYPKNLFGWNGGLWQIDFYQDFPILYGIQANFKQNGGSWEQYPSGRIECSMGNCMIGNIPETKSYAFFEDNGRLIEIFGPENGKIMDLEINGAETASISTPYNIDYLQILGVANDLMLFSSMGSQNFIQLVDLSDGTIIKTWKDFVIWSKEDVATSGGLLAFSYSSLSGQTIGDNHLAVFDSIARKFVFERTGYQYNLLMPLEKNSAIVLVDNGFHNDYSSSLTLVDIKMKNTIAKIDLPFFYRTNFSRGFSNQRDQIAISPDESLLAIGTLDGIILIYDVISKQFIHSWDAHLFSIDALQFSEDGRFLASYSKDGFLTVWGVPGHQ